MSKSDMLERCKAGNARPVDVTMFAALCSYGGP